MYDAFALQCALRLKEFINKESTTTTTTNCYRVLLQTNTYFRAAEQDGYVCNTSAYSTYASAPATDRRLGRSECALYH